MSFDKPFHYLQVASHDLSTQNGRARDSEQSDGSHLNELIQSETSSARNESEYIYIYIYIYMERLTAQWIGNLGKREKTSVKLGVSKFLSRQPVSTQQRKHSNTLTSLPYECRQSCIEDWRYQFVGIFSPQQNLPGARPNKRHYWASRMTCKHELSELLSRLWLLRMSLATFSRPTALNTFRICSSHNFCN